MSSVMIEFAIPMEAGMIERGFGGIDALINGEEVMNWCPSWHGECPLYPLRTVVSCCTRAIPS